jgi:predicted transcriptional regulator of viral defense system
MRGEVSAFYSAIAHWEVKIQGPHNIVVKVLRRKQFELVHHKPSQDN